MSQKAAHVLTEKQKKGSLASVVKKAKQPKNILVRNDIDYWPSLDESRSEIFVQLLETCCKETDFLKHVSIGLESTLRNLKKENEVKVLVIANEISPKWFGKQMLAMVLHKSQTVRVIIVPSLKDITRNIFKIPSIIFAIKKSAETKALEEFYDNQLEYHSELLKHYYTIKPSIDVSIKKKKQKDKNVDGPPVTLLKKSSNISRTFIPATDSSQSFIPMEIDDATEQPVDFSSDFISLAKYTDNSSKLLSKPQPISYRPIKIKKILGNADRKKKS